MSLAEWEQVEAPSNIAILKYWGKKDGEQLPINPSISFTLSECKTIMNFKWSKREDNIISVLEFNFNKTSNQKFKDKLNEKLSILTSKVSIPFGINLLLDSFNTFPHSAGIASSASSMACLAKILSKIYNINEKFEISSIARELSGSASRSIENGWMQWGILRDNLNSSDLHARSINEKVHRDFLTIQDWVFVCSYDEKKTSSSQGHKLMEQHPYRESRINIANNRAEEFLQMISRPINDSFFELIEIEALDLHGLLMTSNPSVILLRPESLKLIDTIRKLRSEGIHCGFTLDAGPTVHLLFPAFELEKIQALEKSGRFGVIGQDYKFVIKDRCFL